MNIVRLTRNENAPCERQVKFVQERISLTEENLSNLCHSFGAYTQKLAKLRDKSDEIAVTVYDYSNNESINRSVKSSLQEFAKILAQIGDCREVHIKNLDKNVVKEFCQYEAICRNAKAEVRSICGAKDREQNKRRHLNKVRARTPHNVLDINKAEIDLVKATAEVSRMQKALEEHIDIFEKKKLQDIKLIFKQFVTEELAFHARVINFYTDAYNCIQKIDENEDLEEFREVLKVPEMASRLEMMKLKGFTAGKVVGQPSGYELNLPHSVYPCSHSKLSVGDLERDDSISNEQVNTDEESKIVTEES